jgi:hypothetical protein
MKSFEEIKKEFATLTESFESLTAPLMVDEKLVELAAKHALYEIEPFFSEHNNEFMDENSPSVLINSEEDFNPEKDDYYIFKVNLETRKAHYRKLYLGSGISYDTVFEYHDEYYKSATIYINPELKKSIKLCYLFFKDGMPDHHIECSEYGVLSKKYYSEDQRLLGYTMENIGTGYIFDVKFEYNYEGALQSIIESYRGDGKPRTIFKRPGKNENIDDTLQLIEDQLVEEIADQIQSKVQIDEKVYCVLLEYTLQHPFPPTIGIGVESEMKENMELYELYNAPDMQYFSEGDNLDIDLYPSALEDAYLFIDRVYDNMKLSDEEYEKMSQRVKEVYLKICKRLMHMNFDKSFAKTHNFLVLARDFEACNEGEYFIEMNDYKKEKGL